MKTRLDFVQSYLIKLKHNLTIDKFTEDFFLDFIKFCMVEMDLKCMINFKLIKRFKSKFDYGYIYGEVDNFNIGIKYSEVRIKKTLFSIAHELTHAKQNINNQLKHTYRGRFWNGTFIIDDFQYNRLSKSSNEDDIDEYNRLPWEFDANENAKILIIKYLKSESYENFIDYLKHYNVNLEKYINL